MTKNQPYHIIPSVEKGVLQVKNSNNKVLMAGRETLFFDIRRFGSSHFHLSEKLNTAYAAIAVQIGCPFLENLNKVLMAIFESGILNKITSEEYEKLGAGDKGENMEELRNENWGKSVEEVKEIQPISVKMVQGAFYALLIGYAVGGLCLVGEIWVRKDFDDNRRLQLLL